VRVCACASVCGAAGCWASGSRRSAHLVHPSLPAAHGLLTPGGLVHDGNLHEEKEEGEGRKGWESRAGAWARAAGGGRVRRGAKGARSWLASRGAWPVPMARGPGARAQTTLGLTPPEPKLPPAATGHPPTAHTPTHTPSPTPPCLAVAQDVLHVPAVHVYCRQRSGHVLAPQLRGGKEEYNPQDQDQDQDQGRGGEAWWLGGVGAEGPGGCRHCQRAEGRQDAWRQARGKGAHGARGSSRRWLSPRPPPRGPPGPPARGPPRPPSRSHRVPLPERQRRHSVQLSGTRPHDPNKPLGL
jgi:hypothetical protein